MCCKSRTRETFHAAIEDARVSMRIKHKLNGNDEDDFGLVNVEELNNQIDQFTATIAAVLYRSLLSLCLSAASL